MARPPRPGGGRSCAAWQEASQAASSPAASRAALPDTRYRGTPADPAAAANAAAVQGRLPAVPFHGKYQAGILPAPQRATAVVSFTATASSRAELAGLSRP